jgi:hypothetical protein
MYPVLKGEVKMSTLTKFSVPDWKCILSGKELTKGVWENLLTWINLNPKHEEHFFELMRDCGSDWCRQVLANEDVAEAHLLGKKFGIDNCNATESSPLLVEDLQSVEAGVDCLLEKEDISLKSTLTIPSKARYHLKGCSITPVITTMRALLIVMLMIVVVIFIIHLVRTGY